MRGLFLPLYASATARRFTRTVNCRVRYFLFRVTGNESWARKYFSQFLFARIRENNSCIFLARFKTALVVSTNNLPSTIRGRATAFISLPNAVTIPASDAFFLSRRL